LLIKFQHHLKQIRITEREELQDKGSQLKKEMECVKIKRLRVARQ
jgi:hypothetical protein